MCETKVSDTPQEIRRLLITSHDLLKFYKENLFYWGYRLEKFNAYMR